MATATAERKKRKKKPAANLGFTEEHMQAAQGPQDVLIVPAEPPADMFVGPSPLGRVPVPAPSISPSQMAARSGGVATMEAAPVAEPPPQKKPRAPSRKAPGTYPDVFIEESPAPEPGPYAYGRSDELQLPEEELHEAEPSLGHVTDVVPMPLGLGGVRTIATPKPKPSATEIAARRRAQQKAEPVGRGLAMAPGIATAGVEALTSPEAGGMIIREEDDMSDLTDGLEEEAWDLSDITRVSPHDLIGGPEGEENMNDVFAVPEEDIYGGDPSMNDILDIDAGALPGEPDPFEVTDEDIYGEGPEDMEDIFGVLPEDIGAEPEKMDKVFEVGPLDSKLDEAMGDSPEDNDLSDILAVPDTDEDLSDILEAPSEEEYMEEAPRPSKRPIRRIPPGKPKRARQLSAVRAINF